LLTLPTRRKQSNETLMDYSNSHVVTLDQYVVILKYKVMDEENAYN
jgi:hypothetical protein